jgi:hypothetical protein
LVEVEAWDIEVMIVEERGSEIGISEVIVSEVVGLEI